MPSSRTLRLCVGRASRSPCGFGVWSTEPSTCCYGLIPSHKPSAWRTASSTAASNCPHFRSNSIHFTGCTLRLTEATFITGAASSQCCGVTRLMTWPLMSDPSDPGDPLRERRVCRKVLAIALCHHSSPVGQLSHRQPASDGEARCQTGPSLGESGTSSRHPAPRRPKHELLQSPASSRRRANPSATATT